CAHVGAQAAQLFMLPRPLAGTVKGLIDLLQHLRNITGITVIHGYMRRRRLSDKTRSSSGSSPPPAMITPTPTPTHRRTPRPRRPHPAPHRSAPHAAAVLARPSAPGAPSK